MDSDVASRGCNKFCDRKRKCSFRHIKSTDVTRDLSVAVLILNILIQNNRCDMEIQPFTNNTIFSVFRALSN